MVYKKILTYKEQACATCGQLIAVFATPLWRHFFRVLICGYIYYWSFFFYFLQGDVSLCPFPCAVVCTTIWRWFPTPSTIQHNKRQPLTFTRFFSTRLMATLLGMIAHRSCPSLCVPCTPLLAVYHASLAESFANEFEKAASFNCKNTVILGRRIWLVINSQMQKMRLTALEHHKNMFHQLLFQSHERAVKFNSGNVIEARWGYWVSTIQNWTWDFASFLFRSVQLSMECNVLHVSL